MTVVDPSVPVCPNCRERYGMLLSNGLRFCFACRHEWDGNEIIAAPSNVVRLPEPDLPDVPAAPPDTAPTVEPAVSHDDLIGTAVILEGGQRAIIHAFPDDDHMSVQLSDGSIETLDFNDVQRSVAYAPELIVGDDNRPAEAPPEYVDAALTISALIIKAGIASIRGEGEAAQLVEPPTGWLKPTKATFLIVEHASALAVASLIRMFDLPVDMILASIDDHFSKQAESDQQTEVTHDASPGGDPTLNGAGTATIDESGTVLPTGDTDDR